MPTSYPNGNKMPTIYPNHWAKLGVSTPLEVTNKIKHNKDKR
jgi:hypothetical protein